MDDYSDFSEEERREIAAWERERQLRGKLLVAAFVTSLILLVGCGVAGFYLGSLYGAVIGWAAFLAAAAIVFVIFNWIAGKLMFKTGKKRQR